MIRHPPRSPLFPYTPLFRSISYLLRHKKSLALGGVCVAGSAIFSLTKPWIVGSAVNTLAKGVNRADLIRYGAMLVGASAIEGLDRKSTRLNSSHLVISYAVF